jgi:hypothetical protein
MPSSPSFDNTTKLVARALGVPPAELLATFRPAVLDDLPAVLSLRTLEFGPHIAWDDKAYLCWRYRLGRADCGLGELWVVNHNDELLGMIGTEDMVCMHAGRRLIGMRSMDILVDPRAKNSGLGVWLNQALFRRSAFTLVVGSNPNSIGIMKRLYRLLPPGRLYYRYVDFRRYLERRFGKGSVAWIGAHAGKLIMRSWQLLSQLRYSGTVAVQPIHRFDDSVSALLAKASMDGNEVVVDRSASYLNRRLFDNPRAQYRVWGAYREREWLGYIAWRIVHRDDGEIWMHIMDMVVDARHRISALGALLAFTSRQAELGRCSFIGVMLQDANSEGIFRRQGFLGPKGDHVVTVHAENPSLLETLCQGRWNLTDLSFDRDGY